MKYLALLVITLLLFSSKAILTPAGSYEGGFYSQLAQNLHTSFFTLHPLKYAIFHYVMYAFPSIIFCMLLLFYRRKNDISGLLYLVITCLTFLIITQLTFGKGDSDVMMEKDFMPYALFIGIPLLDFWVNHSERKEKNIIIYTLFAATLLGMANEIRFSKHLKGRINFYADISSFAAKQNKSKLILPLPCLPNPAINWAIGAETLLYSSLNGKGGSMTVAVDNGNPCLKDSNNCLPTGIDPCMPENLLNQTYFDLKHQKYVNVSCEGDTFKIIP